MRFNGKIQKRKDNESQHSESDDYSVVNDKRQELSFSLTNPMTSEIKFKECVSKMLSPYFTRHSYSK